MAKKTKITTNDLAGGKDIVDLINDVISAENKKAKQVYENAWKKAEAKLVFEHHKQFHESDPWTQYHCNMFKEMPERLADIFSRYFAVPDDNAKPYDYFLDYFKNLKTTNTRWDMLPSEIRLKNQYVTDPFDLKNMPPVGSPKYQDLARLVVSIFVRCDDNTLFEKMMKIDKISSKLKNNSIADVSTKMINEELEKAQERLEAIYENFDPDNMYRNKLEVEAQQRAENTIKYIEFVKKVRENMPIFNDKILRKDPTKQEYEIYADVRKKELRKANNEKKKEEARVLAERAILKKKEEVVANAREQLRNIVDNYVYIPGEDVVMINKNIVDDVIAKIINIENVDKLPELFNNGKDDKEKLSSLLDLEDEKYLEEISKEFEKMPEIDEKRNYANECIQEFFTKAKDGDSEEYLQKTNKALDEFRDSKIPFNKLKFKDEFNPDNSKE